MRRSLAILGATAVVVMVVGATAAGAGRGQQWGRHGGGTTALDQKTGPGSAIVLNETEQRELRRMREEEKLARDTYRTLGEKWGLRPFLNIQRSEEQHLAIVGDLITRSGTPDPVTSDVVGAFQSPEMRGLYVNFTREGGVSPEAALRVGARIEELDIADLEKALSATRNPTVRQTYEGLLRASRNHLRAFTRNLEARNVTYVPLHLPADRFAAILAGSHESCGLCGSAQGASMSGCGGGRQGAANLGCGSRTADGAGRCGAKMGASRTGRGGRNSQPGRASGGCGHGNGYGCAG